MAKQTLHIDIAIVGGGVAGLWALNQLRNRGFSAVLFEQEALGGYQTMASQGMIHGGIKYALGGAWSGGSEAISAMPNAWRDCLNGEGPVDLRGAQVLSEDFYLWSDGNLQSRMSSFLASKMLRGRVEKLSRKNYPAPLQDGNFKGQVYRLIDMVMDMPSVVAALVKRQQDAIFSIDWQTSSLERRGNEAVISLADCDICPSRLLLTAGVGNEALLAQLGASEPLMQRRPLQQVIVKHEYEEPFFGHCTGGNPSPRLTVSSHRMTSGEPVWYLGGDLATEHAEDEPGLLIDKAKAELDALLPWIDFGKTEWRTIQLDRAEPRQNALLRPDRAFVGRADGVHNTLVAWPTKLSLSPDLGDEIERLLEEDDIAPIHPQNLEPLQTLARPDIAATCWDQLF
ncbi:MAG: FAD-dependent oxidoreductase [Halieaceae bacterium]